MESTVAEKRDIGLDLLKILACFAVVTLHATGNVPVVSNGYGIQNTLYYLAAFAVPVFFMVNGRLLLTKTELTYRYVLKKILNILLIAFAWNMLLFLERLAIEGRLTNPFLITLSSLTQGDYFWQFWFFGALIAIYLVLPVIHKFFRKTKPALIMTGFFVALCIAADIANIVRSTAGLRIIQAYVPQVFRLWTWLAYFLLGGLLGKKEVREFVLTRINAVANWVVFAVSLAVVSVYQYKMAYVFMDLRTECFYDNIFIFIYSAAMFILINRQDFSKRKNTVIKFISQNVMGIYIIHVSFILLITRLVAINTQLADVCLLIIVFSLSLIVSSIIGRIPVANRLIRL